MKHVLLPHEPMPKPVRTFVAYATKVCTGRFPVPMRDCRIVEALRKPSELPRGFGVSWVRGEGTRRFDCGRPQQNQRGVRPVTRQPPRSKTRAGPPRHLQPEKSIARMLSVKSLSIVLLFGFSPAGFAAPAAVAAAALDQAFARLQTDAWSDSRAWFKPAARPGPRWRVPRTDSASAPRAPMR
jgi:hypothetical protein